MDLDLKQQIANEETLTQRLNNLNIRIEGWLIATKNVFLKEGSKEFKEWKKVGEEIDQTSLTPEGRLRLKVKHELMEGRVLPKHSVLLLSALPLLTYWLLKKGLTYLVSSRIEDYQKQQARNKRRLEQAREKMERRESKGLPATSSNRRKRK